MYSRAEQFRHRGIEAQQRAAEATEASIKQAFEHVARNWFALAEHADWLRATAGKRWKNPGVGT